MDEEQLKRRLSRIVARTEGAQNVAVPGWWGLGNADERRVMDDQRTGRLAWRAARRRAMIGLDAVRAGELEKAEVYLWCALDSYVEALESRIEPRDLEFLSNSARPRGRKKSAERK